MNEFFKSKGPADEEHKEYFVNGNLMISYTKKNGDLEGDLIDYYKNGKIISISHFEHGHFNGTNQSFNELGQLTNEEIFAHDTLLSLKEIKYYKNGSIEQEESLIFDKDSLKICPFGKLQTKLLILRFDYGTDKLKSHGKQIQYFKNGKISQNAPLINELYEGIVKGYYDDGTLYWEGLYHNDYCDGVFLYYDVDGALEKREIWEKGKKIRTE